jgi:hypothetical protein
MEAIGVELEKATGGYGFNNLSIKFRGNITAVLGDLRVIKQQLASFNRAWIDDSDALGMEAIGVDLEKAPGRYGFNNLSIKFRGNITAVVGDRGDIER